MARKKSSKQTDIERRYNQKRKNLERQIKRWEKKGYKVNVDLPRQPKKITEGSIRNLGKVDVQKNIEYGGKTGYYGARREKQREERRQEQERERERERDEGIANMGEVIYKRILDLFGAPQNNKYAEHYLNRVLEDAIHGSQGWNQTMRNLYYTDPEVIVLAEKILIDSEAFREEQSSGYWALLVKQGEEMTQDEAREIAEEEEEIMPEEFEETPWEESPFDNDDEQQELGMEDEDDEDDEDEEDEDEDEDDNNDEDEDYRHTISMLTGLANTWQDGNEGAIDVISDIVDAYNSTHENEIHFKVLYRDEAVRGIEIENATYFRRRT